MRANQLRLWFASLAYVLICALRRIGLAHTQFAAATCGTIRLKLLKIGAQVRLSVRRLKSLPQRRRGSPWPPPIPGSPSGRSLTPDYPPPRHKRPDQPTHQPPRISTGPN